MDAAAGRDNVFRRWRVRIDDSGSEINDEGPLLESAGLSRGLRKRLKSGLEKVRQKTGQVKVRGCRATVSQIQASLDAATFGNEYLKTINLADLDQHVGHGWSRLLEKVRPSDNSTLQWHWGLLPHPILAINGALELFNKRANTAEEGAFVVNKRADAADERLHVVNERLHIANERLHVANERLHVANERLHIANERTNSLSEKLMEEKGRANDAEAQIRVLQDELEEERKKRSAKDLIRLNQLQEDEQMRAWVAQEDDFVLAQAKKRAAIRDEELEYRDPVKLIESLNKTEECEALRKDVEGFEKMERLRRARNWWAADIDTLLKGKTVDQLNTLEGQVRGKLEGHEVVDTDYWGELLDRVGLWKARKATEAVWKEVVEKRIQQLKKERAEATDDDLDAYRNQILKQGFIPAPSASNNILAAHSSSTKGQTASLSTTTAQTALDKLIARGPLYFNRVALGYDWNKYNQTHYSADNPPPRVVQGYKFHIFYPDLPKHTTKAPTYKIIRESGRRKGESRAAAGEEDMCIIRFSAGPPYEDIAFRIVDRDWDYSGKEGRGFKSVFQDGVLTLWFSFRKVYYRK
ncbi:hypothetical protein DV735_g4780, partial [Chaetothyriales sp. CBS 134920]